MSNKTYIEQLREKFEEILKAYTIQEVIKIARTALSLPVEQESPYCPHCNLPKRLGKDMLHELCVCDAFKVEQEGGLKWVKASEIKIDRQLAAKKDNLYGILVPWFGKFYFHSSDFLEKTMDDVTDLLNQVYVVVESTPSIKEPGKTAEEVLRIEIAKLYPGLTPENVTIQDNGICQAALAAMHAFAAQGKGDAVTLTREQVVDFCKAVNIQLRKLWWPCRWTCTKFR
jgi:hypothetical protein